MNMHDITFRGLTAYQLGKLLNAAFGSLGSECPDPEIETRRQDKFDVTLASVGANKIQVIKAIREITGLGLKEAKDLAEAAPQPVVKQVTQAQMKAAVASLREAGATVEVT